MALPISQLREAIIVGFGGFGFFFFNTDVTAHLEPESDIISFLKHTY